VFGNYYVKCFIGLWAQVSQWRRGRSNHTIYMCRILSRLQICVDMLLVDLYMLLFVPLAKYKVRLHSMPCCLASN